MNTISFVSPQGDIHNFQICNYIGEWNEVGGIYMFCRFNEFNLLNGLNGFEPLYIGKSNNFKVRLSNHEKWTESVQLGAQKVLAAVEHSESKRNLLEFNLIQYFNPQVNKQLRPLYSGPGLSLVPQISQNLSEPGLGLISTLGQYYKRRSNS